MWQNRFSKKKGEKVLSLAQRTSLQLHEIHECFRAKNKDKHILFYSARLVYTYKHMHMHAYDPQNIYILNLQWSWSQCHSRYSANDWVPVFINHKRALNFLAFLTFHLFS